MLRVVLLLLSMTVTLSQAAQAQNRTTEVSQLGGALSILNVIRQGLTEVDPYVKPGEYYNVNADGKITTSDAHQVLALLGL